MERYVHPRLVNWNDRQCDGCDISDAVDKPCVDMPTAFQLPESRSYQCVLTAVTQRGVNVQSHKDSVGWALI